MAENFRRVSSAISSVSPSGAVLYTAPSATTTVGLSLLISYVGDSTLAYVTASVSGTTGQARLVRQGEVLAGSSLELIANKLVLQSGDSVIVGGSSTNTLEATFSYLELS
jgi:hypothetical protein